MATEYELKFSISEEAFQRLRDRYPGTTIRMETTYYDTKDRTFSRLRGTLRIRKENEKQVCTLKLPSDDGARLEYECDCTDLSQGITHLSAMDIPETAKLHLQKPLIPVCGAAFTRIACDILWEGSLLEIALDEGFLLGRTQKLPLREVEVELKEGTREAAQSFARVLQETHDLQIQPLSKFARAKEVE